MLQNKLIRILSSLNRKEMTRFRDFAFSPYFNKHKDLQLLLAYLSRVFPKFDEKSCSRKEVFRHIYPAQAHDQRQLALLFTYALRLLEKFLAQEQFKVQIPLQELLLLQSLRTRKQYSSYEKVLRQAETQLSGRAERDSLFYNHQYQLAAEADNYYNQIERRQKDHSIQSKQNNLDKFYLSEKLKDACEMRMRSKILKVDYSTRLLEAVIREVRNNIDEYVRVPAIYVYYKIYLMVLHSDHQYYFEALKILEENETYFSNEELDRLYNYFQNYCIEQINRGEERFLGEIFKLYQSQLANGLLIKDGYLSEWHYKNIVTTGIRLREMDWVKGFIEEFKARLRPEAVENAYMFNLASYYYATRQYDEVLNLLIKVEYNDLRYNLGAKALLLRTYYDLKEYDALHSLTESFKQYLHRNKLMADSRRQGYYNLFKLTHRAANIKVNLSFIKEEKAKKELKKLQSEIKKAATIFNKAWLLEKVNELEEEIVGVGPPKKVLKK